jgi:cell division septation protein DedD
MDWLKRNWVDVLMAGLILAVVGGFLTLLLRGGVFVSKNPADIASSQSKPTVTTVPAPTSQPDAPVTPQPDAPVTPQPDAPANSSQPDSPVVTPKTPTPVAQTSSSNPSTTDSPQTAPLDVPEIPEAPQTPTPSVSNTNTATTPSTASSSNTATNSTPNQTVPITPNQTVPITPNRTAAITPNQTAFSKNTPTPNTPASAANSETNSNYARADFLRNYRIAAGSYSSLERAKKAVSQLKTLGLPAQSFPSGNTYVVVVGPYAREASARIALGKIKKTFPDAVLYRPDGTREASARVVTPQSKPQPSGGGGTSYLQVGAFKDSKSAAALFTKLKDAGFNPLTKSTSGLLRVLVGPFTNDQIKTTRSELKNQGFEAFPINL